MSKYSPIATFLSEQSGAISVQSFAAIEDLLGLRLPPSARIYREWWSNARHTGLGNTQAKNGWMAADWLVTSIDLSEEKVTFERSHPPRRM